MKYSELKPEMQSKLRCDIIDKMNGINKMSYGQLATKYNVETRHVQSLSVNMRKYLKKIQEIDKDFTY